MNLHVIDLNNDEPFSATERRLADLPDRVVTGDPQHRIGLNFESSDGELSVGTWTSTPGKWHAFAGKDEYCYIVSGRCALIHEDGTRNEFTSGSSFFIPNGFRGYWEVIEATTKHFVIRNEVSST